MGEWMYRPTCFDLCTCWRWVVRLTPRLLYPRGRSPRYALDRRLGGPQIRSRRHGEVKKIFPSPGLELRPLGCLARSQAPYRLRYPSSSTRQIASLYLPLRSLTVQMETCISMNLFSLTINIFVVSCRYILIYLSLFRFIISFSSALFKLIFIPLQFYMHIQLILHMLYVQLYTYIYTEVRM
jgi:hypothetical protein